MTNDMDWKFYTGIGLLFIFFIAIMAWLFRDWRKEQRRYPFKHKKDK